MSEKTEEDILNEVRNSVNVGELVDLKWKLGMAVSSDQCKHVNSPFVTLLLTVSDSSGKVRNHSVEMTTSQFFNLSHQLKEIASQMETV